MVLSECYGFVKYALVCVNLIFWAVGLAGVVLAAWLLTDQTFLMSLAQEQHNFYNGLYILLAAGILMLIVAFLGCCGAFRESQCMLVAFFSCLLVVIVAQIAAGAWLHYNSNSLEGLVKSSVINTVKNKYGVDNSQTQAVDAFQSGLGCCGATGPADWAGSKYATKDRSMPVSLTVSDDGNNIYKVPESCCKDKDSTACKLSQNIKVASEINPAIYNEGCIDKLMDVLNSQKNVVIGVTAGVGILELLGLIFSLVLCCAIGSSDRYKA
ncbi:CD9 antigen-like [Hylaeus anthracinus]|uniref:CD9 antigen-like n=1 Tax=Hylaeus volcanicus TaxID=313075 RepID=UPI0023B8842C|nr:CD9 antigen-like [Hylaeus volcanicus]XP_054015447.1 CD9 antigen-like [Hylaeus anthracinus]